MSTLEKKVLIKTRAGQIFLAVLLCLFSFVLAMTPRDLAGGVRERNVEFVRKVLAGEEIMLKGPYDTWGDVVASAANSGTLTEEEIKKAQSAETVVRLPKTATK